MLTGLGPNLDAAKADPARAQIHLANAKKASTQVINEVRELVYGLRPPMLDDLGLVGALKLHLDKVAADTRLEITFRAPDAVQFPAAIEVAVFRTVIEAVTNVVRHSDATTISASVVCNGALVATVEDNGTSTTVWTPGVGLTGMLERVEGLGGTLEDGPTESGGPCDPPPGKAMT